MSQNRGAVVERFAGRDTTNNTRTITDQSSLPMPKSLSKKKPPNRNFTLFLKIEWESNDKANFLPAESRNIFCLIFPGVLGNVVHAQNTSRSSRREAEVQECRMQNVGGYNMWPWSMDEAVRPVLSWLVWRWVEAAATALGSTTSEIGMEIPSRSWWVERYEWSHRRPPSSHTLGTRKPARQR